MSLIFNEWFEQNKDRLTNELFEIQENVGMNIHEAQNVKEILQQAYDIGYCKGKDDEFDDKWVGA